MTEILREMIFSYRMFGFFQEINIESVFRNGLWLFPGTVHSCDAVNLRETLIIVQSLKTGKEVY